MSLLLKCLKLLSPIENINTAHFPTTTKILPELQDMHQLVTEGRQLSSAIVYLYSPAYCMLCNGAWLYCQQLS